MNDSMNKWMSGREGVRKAGRMNVERVNERINKFIMVIELSGVQFGLKSYA